MRIHKILSAIGIVLILLPFSGFPSTWKSIFIVIAGATLTYISYTRRPRKKRDASGRTIEPIKTFSESKEPLPEN